MDVVVESATVVVVDDEEDDGAAGDVVVDTVVDGACVPRSALEPASVHAAVATITAANASHLVSKKRSSVTPWFLQNEPIGTG